MSRIFIRSVNNDRAIQLRDWLVANGWDDIFLDLDPERGIAAGERWKEALQKAAQRCEVVLALISPEWLASDWCKPELNTAQLMGKKIIVLLIGSKPSDVPGDLKDAQYVDLLKDAQYVDLVNDPDAHTRLKEGLKHAGLDPASFPFAEGRRPYPGLAQAWPSQGGHRDHRQASFSRHDLLEISPFQADAGELIGKHPADVSSEILSLKFRAQKPLKAIREKCIDCCCGNAAEVRKCVALDCPNWPYRMGTGPFRKKRELSAKQKQERIGRLVKPKDEAACHDG